MRSDARNAPLQPWLHDLEIAVFGPATALSDRLGDMEAPGTGLYVDDVRMLQTLVVHFDGVRPDPVVASSSGSRSIVLAALRGLGDDGPDATVTVRRERVVHATGLTETITVTSRAKKPVVLVLDVLLGGDLLSIAAVKGGSPPGPMIGPRFDGHQLWWEGGRHRVEATFDPAPTSVSAAPLGVPGVASYDVVVSPASQATITVRVDVVRTSVSDFDVGAGQVGADVSRLVVTADDARLGHLVDVGLQDLQALLLSDPLSPEDSFAAAGSPWYLTLFGRDSLWAASFALPLGTGLARGTLRALARRQGRGVDTDTAEEPGKILHEVRRTFFSGGEGNTLDLPPLYYGTVDATALWVQLLHDAWRWGMADSEVEDLLPHLDAALGWLAQSVANAPDGLVRYRDTSGHGLANQGWKDSDDSMRRRDGSLAPAPIALVEAQAYAVSAARKAAALLDHFGREGGPSWRAWADELQERIRSRFWVDGPQGRYLAMAIDAAGRPVDGVGSNMGHVLGTGALRPDEAAAVVSTLTHPTMFGRFGIHTLSKDNPGYNPLGYHTGSVWAHDTAICAVGMAAEGHQEAAGQVVRSLLDAASAFGYRLPELYAGEAAFGRPAPYPASCRPQAWAAAAAAAAVTALLGLEVDIPARTLRLRPVRPSPVGRLVVSGVRFGAADITVRVDADGTPHVEGLPPGTQLTIL